jgi:hypothetical protein
LTELDKRELENMAVQWIDTMQLLVPGASLMVAVTHIDTVSEQELTHQSEFVREVINQRLDHYRTANRATGATDTPVVEVFNGGSSVQLNPLTGQGISELRSTIIQVAKDTPWYGETIPKEYLFLRREIQTLGKGIDEGGDRDGRSWLPWREYQDLAKKCGFTDVVNLAIATYFLHDNGVLRYFGNVHHAWAATEEELDTTPMLDTVFVSVHWIANVIKGLIRHDRVSLMAFFRYCQGSGFRVQCTGSQTSSRGKQMQDRVSLMITPRFY